MRARISPYTLTFEELRGQGVWIQAFLDKHDFNVLGNVAQWTHSSKAYLIFFLSHFFFVRIWIGLREQTPFKEFALPLAFSFP